MHNNLNGNKSLIYRAASCPFGDLKMVKCSDIKMCLTITNKSNKMLIKHVTLWFLHDKMKKLKV